MRCACVWLRLLGRGFLLLAVAGCTSDKSHSPVDADSPAEKLSELGLFLGNGASQEPAGGVMPYDINTPLFSDYADKYRFLKLPAGAKAVYHELATFELPVETMIAKTFAYPVDRTDPAKGRRLIETRILAHRPAGWTGWTYIWNDEQTEATLELAGGTADVTWIHDDGRPRSNHYLIPNANQCKQCHRVSGPMEPIGLKARQLNRDFTYAEGRENQLSYWTRAGALEGAPPTPEAAPRLAVWDDPTSGTLDQRARAWLEVNCAHCHNPGGPARNSGLDLTASQTEPAAFGVFKAPVAAGRGSGGRTYDIVPGKPDESILAFRIASNESQVMMPELGKRLIHEEAVELIRQWIAAMDSTSRN